MNKVGRNEFVVEPFQEDFTGKLSWSVLGNLLLRCANIHANERGFGILTLNESKYSWVLSRFVIEMDEMPQTGEPFTIETWIHSVYRLFTDRLYDITGADGRYLGHAYSIWAMINLDTRKPAELERIANESPEFTECIDEEKPCLIEAPGRVRIKDAKLVRTLDTYYSDIDINNHVNSIRYIEMALDLFPKESFAERKVKRVELAYCAESYCGDKLSFFLSEESDTKSLIEIKKGVENGEAGEVVCRVSINFA